MVSGAMTNAAMADVVIVGAGLAGLICGQQLQQAGKRVVILDKSRGLGGRLATRRVSESCWLDHGCPAWVMPKEYTLLPEMIAFKELTATLCQENIIQAWPDLLPSPDLKDFVLYQAPQGMTAIAKYLAKGLTIERQQLVTAIQVNEATHRWEITTLNREQKPQAWSGQTLILAIPAPQALTLCQPLRPQGLAPEFLRQLQAVAYDPCLTLMVGFDSADTLPQLPPVTLHHPNLRGWGWDSRKRPHEQPPTLVIHSSPEFAQAHFEHDPLTEIAAQLWTAFREFSDLNGAFSTPAWEQIHRWRYARVKTAYPRPYLVAPLSPTLICCGDWCGTELLAWGIGQAWQSGWATATRVKNSS